MWSNERMVWVRKSKSAWFVLCCLLVFLLATIITIIQIIQIIMIQA